MSTDLTGFDVGSMVRLVSVLREKASSAESMQEFAQQLCECLHTTFIDESGKPQTALVRFYATAPLSRLPAAEQSALGSDADQLPASAVCLSLLGTTGILPEWTDRTRSLGHRVIPLLNPEHVAAAPMVAALLDQLGIDVQALTAGRPEVVHSPTADIRRIFHVPTAQGSPMVPGQAFVERHGIRSVIGFGGALPTGEVLAAIMFCTVDVPQHSVELFETIALAFSLAALDLLHLPLFARGPALRAPVVPERVLAGRAALAQALLRAHENATLAQANRAETALAAARHEAARASALAAVALSLTRVTTVEDVISVVVTDGLPVVGGAGLSVALVSAGADYVDISISGGFGERAARTYARLPMDDALPTTLTARTGQVVIVEDVTADAAGFPAFVPVAADVGVKAVVSLPMWAGERLIGAMTCTFPDGRSFLESDLQIMHALAAQAAQAVDRARLLQHERLFSEAIQRSLLTEPPEPDHCEIVVRYVPATELAQVGGDWYDAFLQQDGATVIVIGDVMGHDMVATAAMGQVRGVVRTIGWYGGESPADMLTSVDRAMVGLGVPTIASCVAARIEQTEQDRDAGVRRLRWSNAGHPPPMVLCPDGTVLVLDGHDPDLLLGIDAHSQRCESEVALEEGSTVLLYTDGLIERRGQSLDEGLKRFQRVLADLGRQPLDELCDQLLERMLPGADDDVALLAVRLHSIHGPRPPEAGPEQLPGDVGA